jgi:glycosyltransferase 2 family protein
MKKRYNLFFGAILILLLFYLLKDIDFGEILKLLGKTNTFWIILSFAAFGFSFLLWNIRFRNSLGKLSNESFWFLLIVLFSGIFVNTITPGSNVGGEPVRAYYLSKKTKNSKSKFLGAILADKLLNIIVFLFFVIFAIIFLVFTIGSLFKSSMFNILIGIILVCLVFWIIIKSVGKKKSFNFLLRVFYSLKIFRKKFKRISDFERYLKKRIGNTRGAFVETFNGWKKITFGIGISFLVWIFIFLASYFLFFALGIKISFLSVIVVISISYLIGDVSPIPGGIGVVEGSIILLYSGLGISVPLAIAVALLGRAIYYCYALGLGGLSLVYLRLKFK